jgi:hypothetical protein
MTITVELAEDEQSEVLMSVYGRMNRCREMIACWNKLLPGQGADAFHLKEIATLERVALRIIEARFANEAKRKAS